MSKKLMILIFSLFLMACSNKAVQNNFSENQIRDLNEFSQEIKDNLELNNYQYLKKNMDKSTRNLHILNEIEKIDFSEVNLFMSRVDFQKKNPVSILGLNVGDNTFYFELIYNYDYHSKKWLIYKVNERR